MMSEAIRIRNVEFSYPSPWWRKKSPSPAVDGVSISLEAGTIWGVVGPNGSGKSTLIKLILGWLRPQAGTLEILGRSPAHRSIRGDLGFAAEEPQFMPRISARRWLKSWGKLYGLSGQQCQQRAQEELMAFRLHEVSHQSTSSYSKGMRRRLALAQAFLPQPKIFILDEPFEGLDPLGCVELKSRLQSERAKGHCVLLTSHRLSDVEKTCDHIAVLAQGRCLESGTIESVLEENDSWLLSLRGDRDRESLAAIEDVSRREGFEVESIRRPWRSLESLLMLRQDEGEEGRDR